MKKEEKIIREDFNWKCFVNEKYLDYTVDKKLEAEILEFNDFIVKYKGVEFVGFKGEFLINFNIPNYLGIGRKVSKGFGSVIKV